MRKIKNAFHIITGGRPMKRLSVKPHFIDNVSGHSVYIFEDKMGRRWMAECSWSSFRVPYISNTKDY